MSDKWCFEYDPADASNFGDCCDSLGVVPKPWWWYLLLTLPVELALAYFRETEGGSIGERNTTRQNVVFSIITLLALAPIVARLVAPTLDDSLVPVCDGVWNCYQAFVFTFTNSSALLTCLTLWVRIKFKRFFPLLLRVTRFWFANPMFTFDFNVFDVEVFGVLDYAQEKVLKMEAAVFSRFDEGDDESMDDKAREGTEMAVEHYFALFVLCGGGALTHVIPGAAAFAWIFVPLVLMLMVSHALRVGPLRNRTALWLLVNIPISVAGVILHMALTVLTPALVVVGMLVLSLGLALYVIFHSLVQLAHVPYRLSYVVAYARARHQLRVKEPQSFRSKVRGAKSLANAVTSEVARVEPIAISMHASIREELDSMVSEEVDAINDEPDVAFDSPEARAALIKSRRDFARKFDSKILSMEQELLREVNMERLGRVEGEATPANPHDSRFWFMLTALVFPWEFTLLQDDLALVRRELQRLRVDSAGDRLEYRRELDEQLQRLRSMPQPYLDFATELHEIAQEWAIERQQRLAREEESEDEGEEEEELDEDGFLEEELDEVEYFTKNEEESPQARRRAPVARKKKGKGKAEVAEDQTSMPVRSATPARPPLLKAAAPPPPPGGGGRLEQSIHREWTESSKQLLSTAGFLGDDVLDREPRAQLRSSFDYGEASDITAQGFADLSASQVQDVPEVIKVEQSARSKALDTLKQLLRQLKRLVLFDALGDLVIFGTAFSLVVFSMASNYGLLLYSGASYIEIPWLEIQARDSWRVIDCYSFSVDNISLDVSALGIIELAITGFGLLMSLIFGTRFIILFISDPGLFLAGASELQAAAM